MVRIIQSTYFGVLVLGRELLGLAVRERENVELLSGVERRPVSRRLDIDLRVLVAL